MEFKKCFSLFLLFIVTRSFVAQKEANFWHFGSNAALDFTSGVPVAISGSALNTTEGCSTISDASGNLLFYTDGIKVWNKNNVQMTNGFGLLGDISSSQSALIIKQPGSTTIYYIFTASTGHGTLNYSIVNMALNGGLGDVTTKNILLVTSSCEKLAGVQHCNKQDVWVISHDYGTNAFSTFLVTSAGVNIVPVVSNAGLVINGPGDVVGNLKVSPDGAHLGSSIHDLGVNRFELFDFDNSTGIVSNQILMPLYAATSGAYGIEFSPDGTKFYAAVMQPFVIRQFDLCAGSPAAIINSVTVIGTAASGTLGTLQLGPDNKIYIAQGGKNYLGAINNPNIAGIGCNFVANAVSLGTGTSRFGLPNFVPYYFKPEISPFTFTVNCFSVDFVSPICFGSLNAVKSFSWDFDDPTSGASNSSTLINPNHAFSNAGIYNVKLTLNYACGSSEIIRQNVTVNVITAGTSQTIFKGATVQLIATGGVTYTWTPSQSLDDATSASPIASPTVTTTYTVTVTATNGCSAIKTVTIEVLDCNGGDVFIPNAFSPNSDGNNDVFYARGGCVVEFKLVIFDRWGNKVFETGDSKVGWDGTFGGKEADTGVYAYLTHYKLHHGETKNKSGNISLIR